MTEQLIKLLDKSVGVPIHNMKYRTQVDYKQQLGHINHQYRKQFRAQGLSNMKRTKIINNNVQPDRTSSVGTSQLTERQPIKLH